MIERAENNITSLSWLHEAFAQNPHKADAAIQLYKQQQLSKIIARGFPTRREEAWKYTDVSFLENSSFSWPAEVVSISTTVKELVSARSQDNHLAVFINGCFSAEFSVLDLPAAVIVESTQQALQQHNDLVQPLLLQEIDHKQYPLACLNAAMQTDGLFVYVPPTTVLTKPIHILSIATCSKGLMMYPHHIFVLEQNAQATITEEYVAVSAEDYLLNAAVSCFIHEGARLNYYKIANEAASARHFSTIHFHQQRNSRVNAYSFALQGKLIRNDMATYLVGQGAEYNVKGFYNLKTDKQLIDHHVYVNHAAAHTTSDMDFRGILAQQSRAVFNGKVQVQASAKKTQARQVNHNILLTALAEIDTKPDLEVYADDVQCSHGATVGQLDEEALFYLCSRGIKAAEAKQILLHGFVENILAAVELPAVKAAVKASL